MAIITTITIITCQLTGRFEQTPNNNNTLYLILGLILGFLLLLLLCLLCLILALIFWKRKKKRQKVDPNNKETVIQPNNKNTIIPTISSTTLPTLTQSGKFATNHGYFEDDGHLLDDSLTDVLYEYMFLPNDSVQTTSSLSVSTSDSSSPLQPVAASLSAPQPTKSSSPSSSSKLNSNKSDDNRITCPPHNNNDASKLEKNDFEMTPTPSGSSSSRSDRSLSDQSAPSDDVITSLSSSANLLAVGPERGVKAGPIGRNILMSPPKLHTQPRGFAPASHNVPAAVKNTWGRSKIKDSKSFKAAKELDISDNDVGSKLKESKSFKITKDRDGDGSNDGGSSFSGNLLY
ncbi:hypothetical protein HELRODRAFT_161978 [Helobdella robusta]|uniref:Uncharacterized protein n=1 Tax=Helobdella robusta TaxID=6412 RepID=T1ES41_HELRO|nr:hypothetical protein HELRODRAFT_161978 [Helobdella robusta]ESO02686.1 hypothetical protein HELRODRAFT_161978 [Helobdella robusta]